MRTDTILHQIFVQLPSLLFVLIGRDAKESADYEFSSPEVKETAFRLDGVFIPKAPQGTLFFVELQFQHDPRFYSRLFAEIFVYLRRNASDYDWQAVVVFAEKQLDTGIPQQYRALEGQVHRVYLDNLSEEQKHQHPIDIVELLVLPENTELVAGKARAALARSAQVQDTYKQDEIFKLVTQILTQKFSTLSYEEAQMLLNLNLPAFEETQFYKDIMQRGFNQGLQQGMQLGVQREKKESTLFTAERLLREGCSDDMIYRVTEILPEELAELKKKILL